MTRRSKRSGATEQLRSAVADDKPARVRRDVSIYDSLLGLVGERLTRDGYHQRQRSRWITEAIAGMVLFDPDPQKFPSWMPTSTGKKGDVLARKKIEVDGRIHRQLEILREELLFQDPTTDGAYSVLVRGAIAFRLKNPESFPPYSPMSGEELLAKAGARELDTVF